MGKLVGKKKPYSQRTDLEKINANWKKTQKLFKLEQWSVVIIRAATVIELTLNFLIRKELIEKGKWNLKAVDNLLYKANGIRWKLKMVGLLLYSKNFEDWKTLENRVQRINDERNKVAHRGEFKKEETALKIINETRDIILLWIKNYKIDFELKEIK